MLPEGWYGVKGKRRGGSRKRKEERYYVGKKKKNVFPRFRLIEHQQNKMDGPLRQLAD